MFKIKIKLAEIFFLVIFFTIFAINSNIHKNREVLSFVINHSIAIIIAIVISKIIYNYFDKN